MSGFSKSGCANRIVKQGHLCCTVHSPLLLYCTSLADKCILNRTGDLMKGTNPDMHRLSSLGLPWCCCFHFLSDFELLILSSYFRVCHSLLFQPTKPTGKLLPQKKHFFGLIWFLRLLLQQNSFLK